MDVLFFLKDRTRLIRKFYEHSASPFDEIIRKIEAEEEPYLRPYSEDGEPPFLSQWIEAYELRDVIGRCCIAILSTSLRLYFKAWERNLGLNCSNDFKVQFKKEGFVGGYLTCFSSCLDIDWIDCPVDLEIIEQVVLARNRDQHQDSITATSATYSEKDIQRFPWPFFMSDREAVLLEEGDEGALFMSPSVRVSREKLLKAIEQVENLCEWLEDTVFDAK